ncbi:MAG: hypothetical protein K9H26_13795 [Prolixibacteraceae bacterium]|nr:hypothetical protein [Prolixibacteraceae bacterium]
MKKITFSLFAIFLFLLSNICSADIVISGITSPTDMNGIYTEEGTWASRPYFERTVGMETFSVFYYNSMSSPGWMIYRGVGPYDGGMWYPGRGHWLRTGSEMSPPMSGYVNQPVMTSFSVSGTPEVVSAVTTPLSLWGVVAVFLIAGGFLVFRFYRKKAKIA